MGFGNGNDRTRDVLLRYFWYAFHEIYCVSEIDFTSLICAGIIENRSKLKRIYTKEDYNIPSFEVDDC